MGANMAINFFHKRNFNFYICDANNNKKYSLKVKEKETLHKALSNKLKQMYELTEPLLFCEKQSNGKIIFMMTTRDKNIQVDAWEQKMVIAE